MKTSRKHFKTVDEYLKSLPKEVAERVKIIRGIIRKNASKATEVISYNIPAYKMDGRTLIYFAGFAKHVSLYPYSAAMKLTEKEITKYRAGKGTLQFSLEEKLPVALLQKIVKNVVKDTIRKNKDKNKKKK